MFVESCRIYKKKAPIKGLGFGDSEVTPIKDALVIICLFVFIVFARGMPSENNQP